LVANPATAFRKSAASGCGFVVQSIGVGTVVSRKSVREIKCGLTISFVLSSILDAIVLFRQTLFTPYTISDEANEDTTERMMIIGAFVGCV
jgi:hypothetical protein